MRILSKLARGKLACSGAALALGAAAALAAPAAPKSAPPNPATPHPAAPKVATPAAEKPPKCINFADFKLSFDFPAKVERDQPLEVQLHVSEDRGANWKVAKKQLPGEKQFVFRAPKDGEYWFMCRTKYASGQYLPAVPPAPEIKIVVDTAQPKLELTAVRREGGLVHVCWSLSDANLAPESFKIAYQAAGPGKAWQNVALDPLAPREPGQQLQGEIAFVPQGLSAGGTIAVRAEAADRAGNHAVIERRVTQADETDGQRVAHETAPEPANDPTENAAAAGPELVSQETVDKSPPEMADSFPGTEPPRGNAFPVSPGDTPYPKTNAGAEPPHDAAIIERHGSRGATPESKLQPTEREPIQPPVARQYPPPADAEPASSSADDAAYDGELLPPGIHPHMVNKSQFELLYDVESIGAAGIAQIELWGTSDGGQNWLSYGLDDDARSPMPVKVDGEGIYGFRVVVKTDAGLEGPKPESGDAPDVWVGVDLTKPVGNLISAEQGSGEEAGELVITWEAADERLAPRPISLRMSQSPDGPWHTIASGLENTGHYAWRIDQRTPQRFYLRLEVRDEAGNVRIDDATEPVTVERFRPRGHIRDVRSAEDAGRNSRTTHNLLK